MTLHEKDKIEEILKILAGQNEALKEQGSKLVEVHSTVNEMKVGLEGNIYTDGFVNRLGKAEKNVAEIQSKLSRIEIETAGKKKSNGSFGWLFAPLGQYCGIF